MVSSRSWGIVSLIASWQCSFLSLWESICTRNFFVKVNPEKCWRQVQARMRTKGLYTSAFSIGILSRSFTSQNLWDQLLCSDARLDKFSWLLFSLNHNILIRCKKLTLWHLYLHIKEDCAFGKEKSTEEPKKREDTSTKCNNSKWTKRDENNKHQKSAKTSACSLEGKLC